MKNGYREATFKLLASSYSYMRLVASARKKFLEASAQKPPQRGNEIFEKTKLSSRNLRKAPNRIKKEALSSVKIIVKGYVFYLVYDKGDWTSQQEIDSKLQNYGFVGDLKAIGLIVATEIAKEGKFESKEKPELAYKTKI